MSVIRVGKSILLTGVDAWVFDREQRDAVKDYDRLITNAVKRAREIRGW